MKTKNSGLKVKSNVKAGSFTSNHNRTILKVQSGIKAGKGVFVKNHSRTLLSR